MIVEQRECFLNSRCARGGFYTLRYFLDLSSRVKVIVAFPRLRMFPPRLCISAMRSEVKYVADWFKLLSDGGRKFRLIYNDLTRSILLEKSIRLGAVLAPTLVPKFNNFWIVGKRAKRSLDAFHVLRSAMKSRWI